MTDKSQYEDVCKDQFKQISDSLTLLHKKLFESNGERALVEVIRENTEWRQKMDAMFKKAVAGIIAMIFAGHGLDRLADFLMK